jgi:AraC-like DNA-binding protein
MQITVDSPNAANEELSPKVLKTILFSQGTNYPKGYRLKERYVFDYELELIVFSKGSMIIGDIEYPISQGDIVFRRPGQYTQGIMPYCCYLICADMLGNTGKSASSYDIYKEQDYQYNYTNPVINAIPAVSHPPHIERYHHLFDSVLKEFINPNQGSELILKANVLNILYQLYQDSINPFISSTIPLSPHYSSIKRALDFIEMNSEKKIVLRDLSELSNLSPNHFHRIFTQTMGMTPNTYITKIKLDKAKELLIRTDLQISEISVRCGFENIPYFSYLFKKQTNLSPGEFRKSHSYI